GRGAGGPGGGSGGPLGRDGGGLARGAQGRGGVPSPGSVVSAGAVVVVGRGCAAAGADHGAALGRSAGSDAADAADGAVRRRRSAGRGQRCGLRGWSVALESRLRHLYLGLDRPVFWSSG